MRPRLALAVLCVLALSLGVAPAGAVPAGGVAQGAMGLSAADPLDGFAPSPGDILPAYTEDALGRTGVIRLAAGAFDPLAEALPVDPRIGELDLGPIGDLDLSAVDGLLGSSTTLTWIVQAEAEQIAAAHAAITDTGATVAGAVPDTSWAVLATPAQINAIHTDPAVRWAGVIQPSWKVPPAVGNLPGLLDLEGTQPLKVRLHRADPDHAGVAAAVANVPGVELIEDAGAVLAVSADIAAIPALVAIPRVAWVEHAGELVLHNAEARWVTDTAVRDTYSATLPERLTGAGQTAAVADTGINYLEVDLDQGIGAHIAFADCDGACVEARYTQAEGGNSTAALTNVVPNDTDHRKLAAYFDIGNSGPRPTDPSAHGTHVAGSVAGDAPAADGTYGTPDGHDGMAPGAMLVQQNIATATGGLSTPTDVYQLFRQAYRPSNPASVPVGDLRDDYTTDYEPEIDARTHNNSYGLIAPNVSLGSAEAADAFAWDHEDMAIISSAGNSGPDPASIGAPSIAKNVITSGASANGRQPMSTIDSMANFSSHGPSLDGRFGVDLATPGSIVISPKGGTTDEYHYLQGTSMSGPVLTGLATLVRQYFWDGYGPDGGSGFPGGDADESRRHNPSSALVRATLVNGAERMRGAFTGPNGDPGLDGQYPSVGQGFGLVNLSRSLYFDDAVADRDDLRTWYQDVYRADADAFAIGAEDSRTYEIDVAEGAPLSVTMAYTDAPNFLQGTSTMTNDLHVTATAPGGTTYAGNTFNTMTTPSADTAETLADVPRNPLQNDPVERIVVPEPEPGIWTITVEPRLVIDGPQGFALAASGNLADGGWEPGPGLQSPTPGAPEIDNVAIESITSDLAVVTFTTNEPTEGRVTTTVDGAEVIFVDTYAVDDDTFHGMETGDPDTSPAYGNRPMIATSHEVRLTGLSGGETYDLEIEAIDLDGTSSAQTASFDSIDHVFAPSAPDIGQLFEEASDQIVDEIPGVDGEGWMTGGQLYAGRAGGLPTDFDTLGAFMFRLPEDLDVDRVVGASVELTGAHELANRYTSDMRLRVDLLSDEVEDAWGTQTYTGIAEADARARLNAVTGLRRGGGPVTPYSFGCGELDALRASLADVRDGERLAPFRFTAENAEATSLYSYEFGFNRRSKGPDLRPRLVLHLDEATDTRPGDPSAPAPEIRDVRVQPTSSETSVTVSFLTDVPAVGEVLFRAVGDTGFTTVARSTRADTHALQVEGLDPTQNYEFVVRATGKSGAASVDDNGGEGYAFFVPLPEPVERLELFFDGDGLSTDPPTGSTPDVTPMASLAFDDDPRDPFAATFSGSWPVGGAPAEISGDIVIDAWFATNNATAFAIGSAMTATIFADADLDGGRQPETIIGQAEVRADFTAPGIPTRNTFRIPVEGTATESLTLSLAPIFVDTGNGVAVVHGSADYPSALRVPVEPPAPSGSEELPPGPQPAPSAESTTVGGADLPDLGSPTDADVAAGTTICTDVTFDDPVEIPEHPGPGDDDGDADGDAGDDDDDGDAGDDGDADAGDGDPGDIVVRLDGVERVATSVRVSQERFPADGTDTVVIATAADYPDALAGAPLAALADAPILLTPSMVLVDIVAEEIARLGATRAIILGGTVALEPAVEDGLRDAGIIDVDRVSGPDRFATAAAIAGRLPDAEHAFLVEGANIDPGRGWPDAVSAAPLAAFTGAPVLLTLADQLPEATRDALDARGVTELSVIGGRVAVSDEVVADLDEAGYGPSRVAGANRYETSRAVHDRALEEGMDPTRLWLATGENWPDALSSGPSVATLGDTLVLVPTETLAFAPATESVITEADEDFVRIYLLGGTAALSAGLEAEVRGLVE